MSATIIMRCTCEDAEQDAKHGAQFRLHTWEWELGKGRGGWRCGTCCVAKTAGGKPLVVKKGAAT